MKKRGKSLCKDCKYRFRRVFMPSGEGEYADAEGNEATISDENIIIMNSCLLNGMDLEGEITIDCGHYMDENTTDDCAISFFKNTMIY